MLSKLKYYCAALVLGLSLVPVAAFADDDASSDAASDQIQVSPATNRVTLTAGETNEYELYVKTPSTSTGPTQFRVFATPYSVTNENYELSFSQENSYTQISRWITFKNESGEWVDEAAYSANPGEKTYVTYRVSVPEDVPAGSQYATVFVEMSAADDSLSSSGVKTISRAGIIVYGNAEGETRSSAEIPEYDFDTFRIDGDLTAGALIKNTGNTDFTVSCKYTVRNLFGKELWTNTDERVMLPETSYRTSVTWEDTPVMGIFQVSYKISTGSDNTSRDETRVVMVLPVWVMIIMGLLLTIIIIWIILFIRKRKARKARLLVS